MPWMFLGTVGTGVDKTVKLPAPKGHEFLSAPFGSLSLSPGAGEVSQEISR